MQEKEPQFIERLDEHEANELKSLTEAIYMASPESYSLEELHVSLEAGRYTFEVSEIQRPASSEYDQNLPISISVYESDNEESEVVTILLGANENDAIPACSYTGSGAFSEYFSLSQPVLESLRDVLTAKETLAYVGSDNAIPEAVAHLESKLEHLHNALLQAYDDYFDDGEFTFATPELIQSTMYDYALCKPGLAHLAGAKYINSRISKSTLQQSSRDNRIFIQHFDDILVDANTIPGNAVGFVETEYPGDVVPQGTTADYEIRHCEIHENKGSLYTTLVVSKDGSVRTKQYYLPPELLDDDLPRERDATISAHELREIAHSEMLTADQVTAMRQLCRAVLDSLLEQD